MPPKKGKKGVKIVTDLTTFNQKELKRQQEKDFNQTTANNASTAASQSKQGVQSAQSSSQVEVNRCEEEVNKFSLNNANSESDFNISTFYTIDNKLIDAYYARQENFTEEEKNLLEDSEFLHLIRQINRDLEFVLGLRFSQFWGFMSKLPELQRFLDEFIQNVRKYNDIYKLQFTEQENDERRDLQNNSSQSVNVNEGIKIAMTKQLHLVLQIFYRMSLQREDEDNYFSLSFYQKMVYDNWLFDMAKLIDIAAVYGKSNPTIVQSIIDNLFESDKRFVQDFKESVELIVKHVRKTFKNYVTIQAMIKGEHIKEMTRHQLERHILDFLIDYAELLSNFNLITSTFPSQVLDSLRSTNSLIYLANAYCLTLQMKRDLSEKLNIFLPSIKKDKQDKNLSKLHGYAFAAEISTVKKLCMQTACFILEKVLLNMIGQHTQHFAAVQSSIANQIMQFIKACTGQSDLSKEILTKTENYISILADGGIETIGASFLKKILKKVNILESVRYIEERFLPDGEKDFLMIIVESMIKGQKVQLQKISAIARDKAYHAQNNGNNANKKQENLTLQDQQNITSLFEMLGSIKREICQQIYLMNNKNFDRSLDQLLSGNIPKDDYQVVVVDTKAGNQSEQIDTTFSTTSIQPASNVKVYHKNQSELLKQYMMGEFEGTSKARLNKNKRYYDEHLRAIEQQKYAEDEDDQDYKKKMLFLAGQMQYEDDFDDQNLYLDKNRNREGQKKKKRAQGDEDSSADEEDDSTQKVDKLSDKISVGQTKILQKDKGGKTAPTTQKYQVKAVPTKAKEAEEDEDDDEDDIADMEKLLEGFDDDQDVNYLFQEDEKRIKMQQQQEEAKKRDMERQPQSKPNQRTVKQQQEQQKDQKDQRDHRDNRDNRDQREQGEQRDYRGEQRDNRDQRQGGGQQYQRGGKNGYEGGDRRQGGQQRDDQKPKYVPKGQAQEESKQDNRQREERVDYEDNSRGGYGQSRGSYQQRGQGGRGNYSRGGQRGGGRGRGYNDYYYRDEQEKDSYYTTSNPLEGHDLENNYDNYKPQPPQQNNQSTYDKPPPRNQAQQNQENDSGEDEGGAGQNQRGGRGAYRGRGGRGNSRGGFHNQKNASMKKQGAYYPA